MRCVDVNVLVYAEDVGAVEHHRYRAWLEAARTGTEPLGVVDLVLSAYVRIATNPRVYANPTPVTQALDFAASLRDSPAAITVAPGPRHWAIFDELCRSVEARGNVVPDAYLAAIAIEHNAVWVSADRGFSRFPHLRWQHPLDLAE